MKQRLTLLTLLVLSGCGINLQDDFKSAVNSITLEDYTRQLTAIASDEFQGRAPMTAGEDKTVAYLRTEFVKMGLEPAFGNNFFQDVPLVDIVSTPSEMLVNTPQGNLHFNKTVNFVAFTKRMVDKSEVNKAELVFAGYGIVAPEYNWNDYKDIDVKNKVVVVLINDPGFGSGDSTLFHGKSMTYYGRWTYKFEEAARQGAAGCLIVHEDAAAAYPWSVVTSTRSKGSNIQLQAENKHMDACAIEGWITKQTAETLFSKCGKNYEAMKKAAYTRGFKSQLLHAGISLTLNNTLNMGVSKNVGAMLHGGKRSDECIIYSAHWDHLGIGKAINGDSIYNGATDDGSGVASVLEIAKAFKQLKNKPERSILFLIFTTEESGLLGAQYYVENPVFPMTKTVADINFDVLSFLGRMKDVSLTSLGESEIDKYVIVAAKKQNRYVIGDPMLQNGYFFRADHFWFARMGVPVIYGKGCSDHFTKGKEFALQKLQDYIVNTYHKPSDEYHPERDDLSGAVEDTQLFFDVGYTLSNEATFPNWLPGSIYKRK